MPSPYYDENKNNQPRVFGEFFSWNRIVAAIIFAMLVALLFSWYGSPRTLRSRVREGGAMGLHMFR